MPTRAPTEESPSSTLSLRAIVCSAEWKHAAYPAANSCSGFEPSPLPPMSFGVARSRSTRPSDVRTWPLRPAPVDSASAVYRVSMVLLRLGGIVAFLDRQPGCPARLFLGA